MSSTVHWTKTDETKVAACKGDVQRLQCLHENGYPCNEETAYCAAYSGNSECVRYLHENGVEWDGAVIGLAATYGHLDCLTYAHENGCPWDEKLLACLEKEGGDERCIHYLRQHLYQL